MVGAYQAQAKAAAKGQAAIRELKKLKASEGTEGTHALWQLSCITMQGCSESVHVRADLVRTCTHLQSLAVAAFCVNTNRHMQPRLQLAAALQMHTRAHPELEPRAL